MPVSVNPRTAGVVFTVSTADASILNDGIGAGGDVYNLYYGDGSVGKGWPAMKQWVSFQNM